jgi:hypothetical protein
MRYSVFITDGNQETVNYQYFAESVFALNLLLGLIRLAAVNGRKFRVVSVDTFSGNRVETEFGA